MGGKKASDRGMIFFPAGGADLPPGSEAYWTVLRPKEEAKFCMGSDASRRPIT
jgi:hypothetical protein